MKTAEDVLNFWFEEASSDDWFKKDDTFDQLIRDRFFKTWEAGCRGELYPWRASLAGRLAEIIVLDQFSRNLMRGDRRSYSQDGMALVLAQEILHVAGFEDLSPEEKHFALLPFMHSESLAMQEKSVDLYKALGNDQALAYAVDHRDIIQEFGRFPHRNETLGRESSPEELAFNRQHGGF